MSDALAKFTEAVAAATRAVAVGEALVREQQGKLRMAEDEVHKSSRRLSDARHDLEVAVVAKHEAEHGKPVSFDDRYEFEKRWDAKIDADNKRREDIRRQQEEYRRQKEVKTEPNDHRHEAWLAKGPITQEEAQKMSIADFEEQVSVRGITP